MKKVLSFDIGGTKISYSIINEKGEFLNEIKKEKTPETKEKIELLLKKIIKENEKNIDIIAIATAGAVNYENTRVESSTFNMPKGYNEIEFKSLSYKPVFVENDANAAAWAEHKIGAGENEKNTITITLGTGVGGGFISDGRLIRGYSGKAGEVGSIKVINRNRICTCGRKDCFESYASGTGLKVTAQETALNDEIFKTSIYKDKHPNDITTYDIISGIKQDDKYSKKVFDIWEKDLIIGLINVTNIFEPESIILSGGMAEFTDITRIQSAVNNEIVVFPVKIKLASAGNNSGMIGATLLACEKY